MKKKEAKTLCNTQIDINFSEVKQDKKYFVENDKVKEEKVRIIEMDNLSEVYERILNRKME